jgi:hypothetical protein
MAKKFIINDNKLIFGDVKLHCFLVPEGESRDNVIGGGFWHFDDNTNTIYFYGRSTAFGQVTKEEFENAIKLTSLSKCKVVFSTALTLDGIVDE